MNKKLLLTLFILGLLLSCADKSSQVSGVEGSNILVDSQFIIDAGDDITIVDYGRKLTDYENGHIPNSTFIETSVVWKTVDGINGMLPDPETVALDLEDAGISTEKSVVIYDSGNTLWASRLFWALEYLGHKKVYVLNGGYEEWKKSNTVSTDFLIPERGLFKVDVQQNLIVSKDWVLKNYNKKNITVVDARSLNEYNGLDIRSERGGHIPESINIDWSNNINSNGYFKSESELNVIYESLLNSQENVAVGLCQTGVRGANTYLALRVMGHENPSVYDGSWEEWGNDLNTPISEGV